MALFWGKEDAPAISRPSGTIRRGACVPLVDGATPCATARGTHSFGSEAEHRACRCECPLWARSTHRPRRWECQLRVISGLRRNPIGGDLLLREAMGV